MKPGACLCAALIAAAGFGPARPAEFGRGDVFGQEGVYNQQGLSSGTWPAFGGGASLHLGRYVALFGELNYVRLTPAADVYSVYYIPTITSVSGSYVAPVLYYSESFIPRPENQFKTGGGVRFFIPFRNNRARPFVPVIGGWLHMPYDSFAVVYGGLGGSASEAGAFYSSPLQPSLDGAYFGTGFGMEVGVTRRFGLRPEFRFFREFLGGSGRADAMTFTVGVYYRLGKM